MAIHHYLTQNKNQQQHNQHNQIRKTTFTDRKQLRLKLKRSQLVRQTDSNIDEATKLFQFYKRKKAELKTNDLANYKKLTKIMTEKTKSLIQKEIQLSTTYVNSYSKTFPFFTNKDLSLARDYTNSMIRQVEMLDAKYPDPKKYDTAVNLMTTTYFQRLLNHQTIDKTRQIHYPSQQYIFGFGSAIKKQEIHESSLGFQTEPTSEGEIVVSQLQIEYVTLEDLKVCALCEGYDGNRYLINETKPEIPTDLHPRCRCMYLLVTEKDENMFIY